MNYKIKEFSELFKRRYKLMNIGLEFTSDKKQLFITFMNSEDRDMLYNALHKNVNHQKCVTADQSIMEYTTQWVNGGLSNFDYLMLINTYG
jgi:hypothetical protein